MVARAIASSSPPKFRSTYIYELQGGCEHRRAEVNARNRRRGRVGTPPPGEARNCRENVAKESTQESSFLCGAVQSGAPTSRSKMKAHKGPPPPELASSAGRRGACMRKRKNFLPCFPREPTKPWTNRDETQHNKVFLTYEKYLDTQPGLNHPPYFE